MNSEQCLESNHVFRYYLYYLCWIFSFCQGHSVEQWPTLKIQKFKTKEMKSGAKKEAMEKRRVFNPLASSFKQLVHLAQLVKAFTVPRCSQRSSVRISPGPVLSFFFPNLHFFNYFLFSFDLIFSCYFNSFHIFISCIKNHQNIFSFCIYFQKILI